MTLVIVAVIALIIGGLVGYGLGHSAGYSEGAENSRLATATPAPKAVKPVKLAVKTAKRGRPVGSKTTTKKNKKGRR